MARYQCNACGGTFISPQGPHLFFHVCPPLGVRELLALDDASVAALDPLVQVDIVLRRPAVFDAEGNLPPAAANAERRLLLTGIRRPGHVDQNATPSGNRFEDDPPVQPIATGAGVTKVAD